MTFRSAAISLALALAASAALAADPNSFTLVRSGKTVGRASYTIDTVKDGFHVKAHYEYRFTAPVATSTDNSGNQTGMMSEAQFSSDYKVDPNGDYISGYTQNAATQMLTSFQPSKARDLVTIGQTQGGVNGGGKPVPLPSPHFLVVPDYDPSAIQILLTTAAAHPHADTKYTFLVPGNGMGPKGSNTLAYVSLQPPTDATGTLDGKPVTLKHYQMKYLKGQADLYTDADGKLMEADMGILEASYVRLKFVLSGQ
jgi:hypothetical protein